LQTSTTSQPASSASAARCSGEPANAAPRHRQVVGKDGPLEAQPDAQFRTQPPAREARRHPVEARVDDVRHHDAGEALGDQQLVGTHVVEQVGIGAAIFRQGVMRIGHHPAVPGKMLAHGAHAGAAHTRGEAPGQPRDDLGIAVERAVADDLAEAVVEVQHWRKAEVHARRAQLGRHQPATGLGQLQRPVVLSS
jgi:hypothetical protein